MSVVHVGRFALCESVKKVNSHVVAPLIVVPRGYVYTILGTIVGLLLFFKNTRGREKWKRN